VDSTKLTDKGQRSGQKKTSLNYSWLNLLKIHLKKYERRLDF